MVGYSDRGIDWTHLSLEESYLPYFFCIAVLSSSLMPIDAFVHA